MEAERKLAEKTLIEIEVQRLQQEEEERLSRLIHLTAEQIRLRQDFSAWCADMMDKDVPAPSPEMLERLGQLEESR